MNKKDLGCIGERMAAEFLVMNHYEILEQNFRCKFGEVDLVAKKENRIRFIEVKTRQNFQFGRPCESVNYQKQRRLKKVAEYYSSYIYSKYDGLQIDIIEIYINHIKDAF